MKQTDAFFIFISETLKRFCLSIGIQLVYGAIAVDADNDEA